MPTILQDIEIQEFPKDVKYFLVTIAYNVNILLEKEKAQQLIQLLTDGFLIEHSYKKTDRIMSTLELQIEYLSEQDIAEFQLGSKLDPDEA